MESALLDARRKAYLQAMGIELWNSREARDVGAPVTPTDRQPESAAATPAPRDRSASVATPPQPETPPPFETIPAEAYEEPPFLDQDEDQNPDFELPERPHRPDIASLDWPALEQRVADCRNCDLCESRRNTVFGVGNRHARLMIVGEAPGADEDRQGEPFVGRAGQLLNAMLEAIGLAREQVYIANVLKCRPPGNRDPQLAEVAACQPYLNRQIALISPLLILSVGGVSAKNLLQTDESVGRLRGRIHRYPATDTPLVVTYHPAYLLRRPAEKGKAWQDLQQVHRYLQQQQEPS